jgi:hypothetical protein
MKSRFLILIGVLACADVVTAAEKFKPLFNGKNFDGWHNVNCGPKTWTVKEGMIHCTGKPIGELRTTRMYENFILEVEWRHLKSRGNAGIFVWADAYPAKGQPFHRGVEVQVLENEYGNTRGYTTHGDIFPIHGARMTPVNGRGGQRAFPTENRSKPSPQWNHYRIVCNNGDISLAVNGKVVTQGKAARPRKGYICLESEGSPVQFRNLKIKELPSTKPKPDEIANAFTGFKSLYTGVDLSGWKGKGWKSSDWRLTSEGAKSNLVSAEKFSSYTFFADWRGSGKTVPFKLPNVGDLGELEFPAGKWNRVQITRHKGLLRIEINGKRIIEEQIDESGNLKPGAIELLPGGQFANIFVKTK